MRHDKRFIFVAKVRHRWGNYLGFFVTRFPKVTASLRELGFPINGYLPRLPRPIRDASLKGGLISHQKANGRAYPSLQDLIDEQEPPTLEFKGNIRPIRISRLRRDPPHTPGPEIREAISPIWPGDPYEFESEHKYLEHYASFAFALSPRKGGWDTMRSVELCSVGTFPLIPGLERTSEAVLHGYPKSLLSGLWEMAEDGLLPSPTGAQHTWLKSWAEQYLTSTSQANFMLNQLGYFDSERGQVIYLDFNFAMTPDYVSMASLVGLHRVLQQDLRTFTWPEYLRSDSKESSMNLYGRGFGYRGELAGEVQNSAHSNLSYPTTAKDLLEYAEMQVSQNEISHIVLGGLEYGDDHPEQRLSIIRAIEEMDLPVALVYGGDFTLPRKTMSELSRSSLLFVREFERTHHFSC
jgi:hypothetical protein